MKLSYLAPLAFFVSACAANTVVTDPNGGGTSGTPTDRGVEGGEQNAASAPDANPAGAPYPTKNIGVLVGSVVQNYKFLGYPDGNPANGLQPMSMAQFFDPQGAQYKMIHIQASGTWCTYCKAEIRAAIPLAAKFAERKVVWIVSLAEGNALGVAATKRDLDTWVGMFKSGFPHFLDSGNKNFGPFYDAAALPWNANIDAKTMTILSSAVGAKTTEKDILAELDENLKKIN